MGVTRFTNINGQIIAEKRNATRSLYLLDNISATVALVDNSQNFTDTVSYWPFGQIRSRTGTSSTNFLFCGGAGYYSEPDGPTYVRMRFFDSEVASWLNVDRIWPRQKAYIYAQNNPTSKLDRTGMIAARAKCLDKLDTVGKKPKDNPEWYRECYEECWQKLDPKGVGQCVMLCMFKKEHGAQDKPVREYMCCVAASNGKGFDPCDSSDPTAPPTQLQCCDYYFCECLLNVTEHEAEYRNCLYGKIYEKCEQEAKGGCDVPWQPGWANPYKTKG